VTIGPPNFFQARFFCGGSLIRQRTALNKNRCHLERVQGFSLVVGQYHWWKMGGGAKALVVEHGRFRNGWGMDSSRAATTFLVLGKISRGDLFLLGGSRGKGRAKFPWVLKTKKKRTRHWDGRSNGSTVRSLPYEMVISFIYK